MTDETIEPGHIWPAWDGPEAIQPRSYAEADLMLLVPPDHHSKENARWVASSIVECHGTGRYPRLPGVPEKWYVHVHRRIEPYLREGLRRAQLSAPEYRIERIGGYVWRTIRHRPGAPLSPHARGIAVDIDPDQNRGITFKRGQAPRAWSAEWMRLWPACVTPAFVAAMESCGFTWGADWDEDGATDDEVWLDPMHFEWVARDGHRSDV